MTRHAGLLQPKKQFTFPEAYAVTVKALRSLPDFIVLSLPVALVQATLSNVFRRPLLGGAGKLGA